MDNCQNIFSLQWNLFSHSRSVVAMCGGSAECQAVLGRSLDAGIAHVRHVDPPDAQDWHVARPENVEAARTIRPRLAHATSRRLISLAFS